MKFLCFIGVVVILGLYFMESKFIVCEHVLDKRKEAIWLRPMTKFPEPSENKKKIKK